MAKLYEKYEDKTNEYIKAMQANHAEEASKLKNEIMQMTDEIVKKVEIPL